MSRRNQKRKRENSCYITKAANGTSFPYPVIASQLNLAESLCIKCGICCRDKLFVIDQQMQLKQVKFLATKCQFLQNNLCIVYDTRTIQEQNCAKIAEALAYHAQPECCAYVKANWELIKDWYILPDTK
jgi:uncharacterized cysteine cluster protein YcgN (CxxCxxCC family)